MLDINKYINLSACTYRELCAIEKQIAEYRHERWAKNYPNRCQCKGSDGNFSQCFQVCRGKFCYHCKKVCQA